MRTVTRTNTWAILAPTKIWSKSREGKGLSIRKCSSNCRDIWLKFYSKIVDCIANYATIPLRFAMRTGEYVLLMGFSYLILSTGEGTIYGLLTLG